MASKKVKRPEITVVLVDDHAMVRQGLAHVLEDSKIIKVVGQAGDGAEALELIKKKKPQVVVLDYTLPHMDAVAVIQEIRKWKTNTRILVLTVHENVHYAVKALEAGADGFVIKAAAVQELVRGVQSVFEGKAYLTPSISAKLAESMRDRKGDRSGVNALSPREFQLLRLLGGGLRIQDCARSMHITESTASTYRIRILQKLQLNSTAELIRFALQNGITT